MLAPDGRCKTLDATADGYVRAEALSAVLLHRLSSASEAPAWAAAVVAASAVNQDGRSSALTAPSGPAQQEVLRSALASAGLAPRDVSVLQLHGTGTGLGDPIEVGALAAVFGGRRGAAPLTLASDKSGIGHTEPAAGLTGALHALRAATQRAAQPMLHLRALNPYLTSSLVAGGAGTGMSIPRQARGAPSSAFGSSGRDSGRVAGTSSFAFQGSNAHLLLSVAIANRARRQDAGARQPLLWRRARAYLLPPAHSLLHSADAARSGGACVFAAPLRHPLLSYLSDHVVGPAPIVPGAAFLEAGLAGGTVLLGGSGAADAGATALLGLAGAALVSPLALPRAAGTAWPVLHVSVDAASGAVRVSSSTRRAATEHLQGALVRMARGHAGAKAGLYADAPCLDTAFDREAAAGLEPLGTRQLYADLAAAGLRYGPAFRRLRGVRAGRRAAVAALEPLGGPGAYLAHPAALDSAFQLGAAVRDGAAAGPGHTFVPAAVALYAPGAGAAPASACAPATAVAAAALRPGGSPTGARPAVVRDLKICLDAGRVLCTVHGLESRAVPHAALFAAAAAGAAAAPATAAAKTAAGAAAASRGGAGGEEDLLYEIAWAAEQPEEAAGGEAAAAMLASRLVPTGGAAAALQLLQGALFGRGSGGAAPAAQAAILEYSTQSASEFCGATPAPAADCPAALRQLAAAGMLRTAAQEAAGAQHLGVAVAHGSALAPVGSAVCHAAAKEGFNILMRPADEPPHGAPWDGYGPAVSSGARHVPRIRRSAARMAMTPYQLVPQPRGALGNLLPVHVDVGVAPGPGTVLIAVKAVGLNFRDVLNVSR
jgi:acyl transferase domain-containing protein